MAIVTARQLMVAVKSLGVKNIPEPTNGNMSAIQHLMSLGASEEAARFFLRRISQQVAEQAPAKAEKPATAPAKPTSRLKEDFIWPQNVFMFRKMLVDLGYTIPEFETKEGPYSGDIEGYLYDLNDMIDFLNYESANWGKPLDLKAIPPRREVIEAWNAWNKQQENDNQEKAKAYIVLPPLNLTDDIDLTEALEVPAKPAPVVVPPVTEELLDLDAILGQQKAKKPQEQAKPVQAERKVSPLPVVPFAAQKPHWLNSVQTVPPPAPTAQQPKEPPEIADVGEPDFLEDAFPPNTPEAQPAKLTVQGVVFVMSLLAGIFLLLEIVVIPGRVFVTTGIALEPTAILAEPEPTATTLAPTITVVPTATLRPTETIAPTPTVVVSSTSTKRAWKAASTPTGSARAKGKNK